MREYKLTKGLSKGIKSLVYFAIPFVATQVLAAFPELNTMSLIDVVTLFVPESIKTLTVGGLLVMLANYIRTTQPDSTLGKIV